MNIKFSTYAKKSGLNQILVRMYHSSFDISVRLDLFLVPSDWNSELQLANSSGLVNQKLSQLKTQILIRYNEDYTRGVIINKIWLKRIVADVFDRPHDENSLICQDKYLYFTDFANYWIKEKSSKWKVNSKEYIGKSLLSQYEKFVEIFSEFEKTRESKIALKDMSVDDFYEFANYLENSGYNPKTIERQIGRMKFFCQRCKDEEIKISPAFNQRIYIEKEQEVDGVFLDESEVEKILKKDFSFDNDLETTKDNFTIAVYSGLRSVDFLTNLDISNFRKGYIEILTQKTKTKVVIPVHKRVEEVLKKHHGMLPPKQTNTEFNKQIKILCQLCDIDEPMQGKIFDPKKKRKIFDTYPKYKLVTAHTLRRSFCSNMRGKISDDSLCKIMGWSTSSLLSLYDKNSKLSHANNLLNAWNQK